MVNGKPQCIVSLEAGKELVRIGKPAIPFLIKQLDSEDRNERMDAMFLLTILARDGPSSGYDPDGPKIGRADSVRKWQEWWCHSEAGFVMPDAETAFSSLAAFK
jgi:hypothetical protein